MNHLDEETLILYHYRECDDAAGVERHLEKCSACRADLDALARDLDDVGSIPAPERDSGYGAAVWRTIAPRLERPHRDRSRWWLAAAAALLAGTFLVGRWSSRLEAPPAPSELRERILLVALGEHLDRSEVFLLEVANADGDAVGHSTAGELLRESRLYRQTAYRLGDVATGEVLDELERLLLDVAHGTASTEKLKTRIEEQDVLFKIRVLQTSVKAREEQLAPQRF